jgi:hypothetical protein
MRQRVSDRSGTPQRGTSEEYSGERDGVITGTPTFPISTIARDLDGSYPFIFLGSCRASKMSVTKMVLPSIRYTTLKWPTTRRR